jgi:hypothetical protein
MSNVRKNCLECNTEFICHANKKFCTHACRDKLFERNKNERIKQNIPKSNQVICQICEKVLIGGGIQSHLTTHNTNLSEYKNKFPEAKVYGDDYLKKLSNNISGERNPGYKHNGKLSPFSKNFVKYKKKSDEEVTKIISEMASNAQQKSKENGNLAVTIEYYIKRGYTEEEAKKLLKKRQTTFNKDICIEKYGKEKGIERWNKRQEKWLKSYKKNNFSKISQQLFWSISNKLNDISNIYFAELDKDKQKDSSGVNHEFRLVFHNKTIQPDFIDIKNKKIIEFDGDYWHGKEYSNEREQQRDRLIYDNGFEVIHVKEYQYKENPEKMINECLNYLTQ